MKHLGNIIDQKLSDVEDCRFKKSILIGNVNQFIGNYSTLKNCSKRKLFQSYCTSFYGSELWSLSSKGLEEQWRTQSWSEGGFPNVANVRGRSGSVPVTVSPP